MPQSALIVLAHPEAQSFNAQMAQVARATLSNRGWRVATSDLYAQGFDPREGAAHFTERADGTRFDTQAEQRHAWDQGALPADVKAEVDKVMAADLIVIQFPVWWFGMPAMLKGWIDRVLVYGGLYTSSRRYDRGVLAGKRALISVTLGALEPTYRHNGRNADIGLQLWPLRMALNYVGLGVVEPFIAHGIEGGLKYSDPALVTERIEGAKRRLAERLQGIEHEPLLGAPRLDDFAADGTLKPGAPAHSPFIRHRKDLDLG